MWTRVRRVFADREYMRNYRAALAGLLAANHQGDYDDIAREAARHARRGLVEFARERGEPLPDNLKH